MRDGIVLIVGAGTMGAGIAQVALEAGLGVRLADVSADALDRARRRIREGLARRAAKAIAPGEDAEGWIDTRHRRLEALAAATPEEIGLAAAGVGLVIEAAVEDLGVKRELFATLDAATDPWTVLASNTSALSIDRIADATRHPERVLGLHFFNPAPLMPLVEVVAGPRTATAAVEQATATVETWGKTPIRCRDRPGFIVNRVNRPFTLEALRLLHAGEGTVESIDAALIEAGFPMGPFALMDLIGLDVNLAAARALFEAFDRAPRFRPSPIQEMLVAEGRLGRKAGDGFYRYGPGGERLGVADDFARLPRREAVERDESAEPIADGPLAGEELAERIILAIVNEAYRALGEGVAPAGHIDRAMRLGANHPFGPFEWAARMGLAEVAASLDALSGDDPDTFRPALPLLRAVGAELLARDSR